MYLRNRSSRHPAIPWWVTLPLVASPLTKRGQASLRTFPYPSRDEENSEGNQWAGEGSNLRRAVSPAVLQTAPIGHSGTCPLSLISDRLVSWAMWKVNTQFCFHMPRDRWHMTPAWYVLKMRADGGN